MAVLSDIWSKIKSIGGYILGGIAAVLGVLFGIERSRRKNAEREADNAKAEKAVAVEEKRMEESAKDSVASLSEAVSAVDAKTEEKIAEAVQSDSQKDAYNRIVGEWNK